MTTPLRGDVDPRPPSGDILRRYNAKILDPATAMRRRGQSETPLRPTVYVVDELLVPTSVAAAVEDRLREAATGLGVSGAFRREGPSARAVLVYELTPLQSAVVDAWAVLQTARTLPVSDEAEAGDPLDRVQLHHLLFAAAGEGQPLESPNSPEGSDLSYGWQSAIGRRPVALVAAEPRRATIKDRPVVCVLDSGCGKHNWLPVAIVHRDPLDDAGDLIGLPDGGYEDRPDQLGPLDGVMDRAKGHGTMMCGLVRQTCPDADILSVRLMDSEGVLLERDLINAYTSIAEMVQHGKRIDVVSCSFGFFHEDVLPHYELKIFEALDALGKLGVVVVAAAGNHATSRPYYPAAYTPHPTGLLGQSNPASAPVISVGALNPDGSIAIFSNEGPWVTAREHGVAVVSTFPKIDGGAGASGPPRVVGQRPRQTPDPDNFAGGFATWSGTSMSTPIIAGRIAQALINRAHGHASPTPGSPDAVKRIWDAIRHTPGVQPDPAWT